MPVEMERALMRRAHRQGYKGQRAKQYTFATMQKLGMLSGEKNPRRDNTGPGLSTGKDKALALMKRMCP